MVVAGCGARSAPSVGDGGPAEPREDAAEPGPCSPRVVGPIAIHAEGDGRLAFMGAHLGAGGPSLLISRGFDSYTLVDLDFDRLDARSVVDFAGGRGSTTPSGIAFDPSGTRVGVCSEDRRSLRVLSRDGSEQTVPLPDSLENCATVGFGDGYWLSWRRIGGPVLRRRCSGYRRPWTGQPRPGSTTGAAELELLAHRHRRPPPGGVGEWLLLDARARRGSPHALPPATVRARHGRRTASGLLRSIGSPGRGSRASPRHGSGARLPAPALHLEGPGLGVGRSGRRIRPGRGRSPRELHLAMAATGAGRAGGPPRALLVGWPRSAPPRDPKLGARRAPRPPLAWQGATGDGLTDFDSAHAALVECAP